MYETMIGDEFTTEPFDFFFGRPTPEKRKEVEETIRQSGKGIIIDPFEQQDIMESRSSICEVMERFNIPQPFSKTIQSYDELKEIMKKNPTIELPFIVKPIRAQGTYESHEMMIVTKEEGLSSLQYPCVVQQFINHNGKLQKVFVIGKKIILTKVQKSVGNINCENSQSIIQFNNSKPPQELFSQAGEIELLKDSELEQIAQLICSSFKLNFLGFDVIRKNGNGDPYIIDINHFPSYDKTISVQQFSEYLLHLLP